MGKQTAIAWTNATVNFWTGCKKVSQGCKYCYMFRDKERYGTDPTDVMRTGDRTFFAPLRWKEPKLIFVCSWSDFFIEDADIWRKDAWKVMKDTPHHTYQILTKRPERILEHLPDDWGEKGYPNVWIGLSAEDQGALAGRWFYFTQFPARVKFVSAEPLLGSLNFSVSYYDMNTMKSYRDSIDFSDTFDWVIIGGESGNENGNYKYRPAQVAWFMDIIKQCKYYDIPVFMKQLGTHVAKTHKLNHRHGADRLEWNKVSNVSVVGANKNGDTVISSLDTQEFPKYYAKLTNILELAEDKQAFMLDVHNGMSPKEAAEKRGLKIAKPI